MPESCQGPARDTGIAKEVVKGVDRVVYFNPEELEEVSARWGGNEYEHDSSDPYHKVTPVDDLEASNDFLDCLAKDMLGDKGSNSRTWKGQERRWNETGGRGDGSDEREWL